MEILDIPKITSVSFNEDNFIIEADGKKYTWNVKEVSNRLLNASKEDRNNFTISPSGYGIHWPTLDEDISLSGLLKNKMHGA
ncbi:MAG: DUF2442 domain-containing protein [Saprospiraceae bacterium]|nr:DUF2442 domain-containing protein [Saprospiraceae bacterium]